MSNIYTSNHRDFTVRGTAQQIVTKYEGLAYQATRDGDNTLAQELFQQAEHYKKIANGRT